RDLQKRIEKGNLLDILSDDALADGAKLDYSIAGAELLPTASLFLSGKTAGEETDEMTESLAAGVKLQWDLFSGGLARSRKAAAQARLKKAKDQLSLTEKELSARVNSLGIRKTEVEERIKIQKESVTLAKENYGDARGHYRAGTITLTRLGEFSLSYAEARFTLQSLFLQQRELAGDMEQLLEH
ncbi:MAG: TolC family protein, partial [Desulfobacteraceae bacterium]|nr:TolC family protein [Desulfobacteraceae bacterium]